MKGKKQLYILIPAVLGIWGFILFKILTGISNNVTYSSPKKIPFNPVSLDTMNFELVVDYRDPFEIYTEKPQKKVAQKPFEKKKSFVLKTTSAKVTIDIKQLRFYGIIENSGGTKGLLSYDGKYHYLTVGDKVDGCSVCFLNGDSIGLVENGNRFYVKSK